MTWWLWVLAKVNDSRFFQSPRFRRLLFNLVLTAGLLGMIGSVPLLAALGEYNLAFANAGGAIIITPAVWWRWQWYRQGHPPL